MKQERIDKALAVGIAKAKGKRAKAKVLGRGYYASVYEVEGLAVKVPANVGWKKRQPLSLAFYKALFEGRLVSPHFPKVYALWQDGDRWAVVMEKLHKAGYAGRDLGRVYYDYSASYSKPAKKRLGKQAASLVAALEKLETTLGYDFFDLHSGNIMKRRTRYVITDPVTG